jgi:hypothetical protein
MTVQAAARAMLREGVLGGTVLGLAVAVLGLASAVSFAGSALLGTVLGTAALAVGPVLLAVTRRHSGPAVMAVALGGYGGTVLLLAVVYALLEAAPDLSGTGVGAGLLGATVGSVAGQLRAVARHRALAFGDPGPGDRPPH